MKIKMNDHEFEGAAADLVAAMRAASFSGAADDTTWMAESAARVKFTSGRDVRSDSADHFVADLIAAGLVEEIA